MAVNINAPYGYDMLEVPSVPSVSSSTNIGGNNIRFVCESSENTVFNGKNSYLAVQLQIVQVREDGSPHPLEPIINTGTRANPTAISVPHLSPNPVAVIIDNMKAVLKGVEINNIQFASTTNSIYRTLFESKLEQDTTCSLSAIKPMSIDDSRTNVGVIYDDYVKLSRDLAITSPDTLGPLLSKRMIWALKNQMYNFDKQNINKLTLQIPLPLFYCDELISIGAGERLELIFGISPNWYQNLIQCVGSFSSQLIGAGPAYGSYTVTNKNSGFTNNTINVSITDMKLYLNRGYITNTHVPRNIKASYYMKKFSPVVANLNSGTSTTTVTGTFDTAGKISHIIIGFNVNPSNYPKYSPNDFSCGYTARTFANIANGIAEDKNTTDAVSLIKQIQVKLGQSIYPQESYSLQIDTNGGYPNTNDLFRCYQDYCTFSDALRTPIGALLTFSQWSANPLFVFKTHQTQNDTSNIFSVKVDLNGQLGVASNIFILGLYDDFLTLEYDEFSRIKSLNHSAAAPLV